VQVNTSMRDLHHRRRASHRGSREVDLTPTRRRAHGSSVDREGTARRPAAAGSGRQAGDCRRLKAFAVAPEVTINNGHRTTPWSRYRPRPAGLLFDDRDASKPISIGRPCCDV
jgi:hypothetical protein